LGNDNDNDKRLGLTAKADKPDHKKYNTPKIQMHSEAVQKLHTSYRNRKGIRRPVIKTGCWFVGGDDLSGALHDL